MRLRSRSTGNNHHHHKPPLNNNHHDESSQEDINDVSDENSNSVRSVGTGPVSVGGKSKWHNFRDRFIWTIILILSFCLIIAAGHFYCGILVMLITLFSYKEVIELKRKANLEEKLPLFFIQRWYWFLVTLFGTLYEYITPFVELFVSPPPKWVVWTVRNHTLVGYLAIVVGVIIFVCTLRRYSIRYQFGQLAFLLLSCVAIVGQGTGQIRTISYGLIWFTVTTTSVIVNDISAYLCGVTFGRTKLLPRISPNKTVEGFLGASIVTFIWAFCFGDFLSRYQVMICPETRLMLMPFSFWKDANCSPPAHFVWKQMPTPIPLQHLFGPSIWYKHFWIHIMILAAFASFVAPFGGLMASALKRALKVKDFGGLLPGHGGVTDRFDCQVIMGMFTFLYLRAFVMTKKALPILNRVLHMSQADRISVFSLLSSQMRMVLPADEFNVIHNTFCDMPGLQQ